MIIFYDKKTGTIFGSIDGRVHDLSQMRMDLGGNGIKKEDIGKYIIGYEQTDEIEDYEFEFEEFEEVPGGLFRKVKKTETRQRSRLIEHNMDKFEILQRFEDLTPENPMDYKIDVLNNNLIKLDKTL